MDKDMDMDMDMDELEVALDLSAEPYINALQNLGTFSRDCYFYYVIPDDLQERVADYFKDETWKQYTQLDDFFKRVEYRKTMCRSSVSPPASDDEDDASECECECECEVAPVDTSISSEEEVHLEPAISGAPKCIDFNCYHCISLRPFAQWNMVLAGILAVILAVLWAKIDS